jgi:hypothetical protein
MDNQTRVIFALLILIAILGTVFILKVTGIIKPSEKEDINIVETVNIAENSEEIKKYEKDMLKKDISFTIKLYGFIVKYATMIKIIIFILNIIFAIGMAKLYRKINMPDWAISFQYIYPIINILLGSGGGIIVKTIQLIIALISLSCLCCFFECLNMSKWWPLSIILGIVLMAISFIMDSKIWMILGIILIISFMYAHIISCVRLSKEFNKGIAFLILLIILPGIFQPILGYQRETV